MSKEVVIKKDSIVIPCHDTVTIPREEYNSLIAAKAVNDLILAVADSEGYGCTEIVKGALKQDKYRGALSEALAKVAALTEENEKLSAEAADRKSELEAKRHAENGEAAPEEAADA